MIGRQSLRFGFEPISGQAVSHQGVQYHIAIKHIYIYYIYIYHLCTIPTSSPDMKEDQRLEVVLATRLKSHTEIDAQMHTVCVYNIIYIYEHKIS